MPLTSTTSTQRLETKHVYTEHVWQPGSCLHKESRISPTESYTVPRVTKEVNSVNSSSWFEKKLVYVAFKLKRPLRRPIEPILRLTELPKLPIRRAGQTQRSWLRVLSRYNRLKESIIAKRAKQLDNYNRALARYRVRLAKYELLVSLAKNGRPALKKVKRLRKLPNNPYSLLKTVYTPIQGSVVHSISSRKITGCYTAEDAPPGSGDALSTYTTGYLEPYWPGLWDSLETVEEQNSSLLSADSKALSALYANLNKQEAHIGCMLAEHRQTIDLMFDIAKLIASKSPRRILKALTDPKDISNATLAFLFGVKPLINDVYGLAKSLAELPGLPAKVVIHGNGTSTFSRLVGSQKLYSGGIHYLTKELYEQTTTKVHYVAEFGIDDNNLHKWNRVGLVNPAEIAWELMPWSFVVDWILPIGDYISALTAELGTSFAGGTKTVKTETILTSRLVFTGEQQTVSPWYNHGYGGGVGSRIIRKQTREVLSNLPRPRFPDLKNPISLYHAVEALALLVQRFK